MLQGGGMSLPGAPLNSSLSEHHMFVYGFLVVAYFLYSKGE